MKKITELTDQEILDLQPEQLELMVKYRMAEDGIKILSMPVQPELKQLPAKDASCYSVEGIKFHFYQKQVAESMADMLKENASQLIYQSYHADPNLVPFIRFNDVSYEFKGIGEVKRIEYYSDKLKAEIKGVVNENNSLTAAYKTKLNEYNTEFDKAKIISEEVYGVYHKITEKYWNMQNMNTRFEEYLYLADGDEKIAMKFLKKAYTIDAETEAYILPPKVSVTEN